MRKILLSLTNWLEKRCRWILIVVLLLLTLAATTVLITRGKEIAGYLHPEVFKLLANLVIVVWVSGITSLALNELNASRERRASNRTLLRSTLSEIVSSYNDIKSVRRRLRAQAIRPHPKNATAYALKDTYNSFVLKDTYNSLLQCLNEAQLKLEAQVRLIEGNKPQYPDAEELLKLLRGAESYLGEIIREWEDHLGGFKEPQDENRLAYFDMLPCFVGNAKRSFRPRFARPMAKVFSILSKGISR